MHTIQTAWTRRQMPLLFAGAVIITLILAGCLTIEQMAPPVGPEFSRIERSGVPLAFLERGREVYLSDCTRCHSVEPIDRYSIDRWRAIIERMGPQSKLDDSRTAALQAYVLAAHTVLALEAANERYQRMSNDLP